MSLDPRTVWMCWRFHFRKKQMYHLIFNATDVYRFVFCFDLLFERVSIATGMTDPGAVRLWMAAALVIRLSRTSLFSAASWTASCCEPMEFFIWGNSIQEQCNTTWGSYCQSKHGGYSCPISCAADEPLGKNTSDQLFNSAPLFWMCLTFFNEQEQYVSSKIKVFLFSDEKIANCLMTGGISWPEALLLQHSLWRVRGGELFRSMGGAEKCPVWCLLNIENQKPSYSNLH